jgi:uncharacterized protein YbaA (DUF1428 family)
MRNPEATSFIRNFNVKRIASSWADVDTSYGRAVMPSRENTEYFCYQSGQAKAMADEYTKRVKQDERMKAFNELKQRLSKNGLL